MKLKVRCYHSLETLINFKEVIFPTPKEVVQTNEPIEPITGIIATYLTHELQEKLNHYFPKEIYRQPNYSLVVSYAVDVKGYILDINNRVVKIIAKDNENINYAFLTLRTITQYNDNLVALTIKDNFDIPRRGLVEGFYGIPWTHEERLSIITTISKYKMNEYVYAPKDDRFHRLDWAIPYPEKELHNLEELVRACTYNNITFTWCLHPGDNINLDSAIDYNKALDKLEQLYNIGVRRFGIFFDDITKNIDYQGQVNFINKIDNNFVKEKGDVAPILVVATRYCNSWGPSIEEYFKYYLEKLNPDIDIMWTGQNTTSPIKNEYFKYPLDVAQVKRNLAIWWNYPVNDYCDRKLLIGPVYNLESDLENINCFYANPMHQAEASKIALISCANFTWNMKEYSPLASYNKALKVLVGSHDELLRPILNHMGFLDKKINDNLRLVFNESTDFDHLIEKITPLAVNKENIDQFIPELIKLANGVIVNIKQIKLIENKAFLSEITPFAKALNYVLNSLIYALQYAQNHNIENFIKARHYLLEQTKCTVNKLKPKDKNNPVNGENIIQKFVCEVGAQKIIPLINLLLNY